MISQPSTHVPALIARPRSLRSLLEALPRLPVCGCLLALVCGFLFFYHLGERALWSSHEGRAAQNARSVLQDGYWGVPRLFDQQLELQKPPLYYWLVAGVGYVQNRDIDAETVRLPAAISGLMIVLLVCLFASVRARPKVGFLAALVLATAVHFTRLSRIGRIDIPLTLAVGSSLLAFFQALHPTSPDRRTWPWFLVGYVGLAAAVLLKGPVGPVLAGAVLALHLVVEGLCAGWTPLRRLSLSLLWGLPLLLAFTLPWFVWANSQTHGRLLHSFFWYHNIERALGGTGGLRAHDWWLYFVRVGIDFFPWSLLLPAALVYFLRSGRWRDDPEARFGLTWFLGMLVVLSCARFKRADYLLPAYPGAALFLGCVLSRWLNGATDRLVSWSVAVRAFVAVSVLGSVIGWWWYVDMILPRGEAARESRSFAAAIRRVAPAPKLVIFFRVEAHALAFHVGRPINTVLEWENINTWAGRPGPHYFVMTPDCARDWAQHVTAAPLETVCTNAAADGAKHEPPLVLGRTAAPRPAH